MRQHLFIYFARNYIKSFKCLCFSFLHKDLHVGVRKSCVRIWGTALATTLPPLCRLCVGAGEGGAAAGGWVKKLIKKAIKAFLGPASLPIPRHPLLFPRSFNLPSHFEYGVSSLRLSRCDALCRRWGARGQSRQFKLIIL